MSDKHTNFEELEAGAFEIATLAIQLAALHGQKKPDLQAAVDLLMEAHDEAVQVDFFNLRHTLPLEIHHRLALPKGKKNLPPVERIKTFRGSEEIEAPEVFDAKFTVMAAIKRISGSEDKDRCGSYRDRFARHVFEDVHGRKAKSIDEVKNWCSRNKDGKSEPVLKLYFDEDRPVGNLLQFWVIAWNLAPFCPRFKEHYPETATAQTVQRDDHGKFSGARPKGPDGKFVTKETKKGLEHLDPQISIGFTAPPQKPSF